VKQLSEIAEVMVGVVVQRKTSSVYNPQAIKYKSLTLKSFNPDGWFNKDGTDEFETEKNLDPKFFVLKGDVVIRLSSPYTAIAFPSEQTGYVISSLFAVIRPNQETIDSNFLALYLNNERIKKEYLKNSLGTTIPMLRVGSLRDTRIFVPNMDRQVRIGLINQLIIRERMLLHDLVAAKENFYQALTNELTQEEK
jgi:restriction endonuclease S subunit